MNFTLNILVTAEQKTLFTGVKLASVKMVIAFLFGG